MRSWFVLVRVLLMSLLAVAVMVACEESDNTAGLREYGPGVTLTPPSFTPISNATPVGRLATTSASPVAAATGAAATGGSSRTITVVGKDDFFEQREITIRNQESVQLLLRNEGRNAHNLHVVGVRDASGREPTTDIIFANQETRLTFSISQPGTYTYRCDVHPTDMTGRLIVQ